MKGTRTAFFTSLALSLALAATPVMAQKAKAKRLFDKGVAAMEDHDYKEALEHFEGAYEAAPHWAVLAHIGNCHAKLNEPVESIGAYEKYLKEGGEDIPKDERKAARKALAEQRKKVGVLHLLVKPKGTETKIDGQSIGESPFEEILLKAGPHHLLVIRGDQEEERDISIYSGKELTVRMYPEDDSVAAVVGAGEEPEPAEEPGEEPEPAEEEPAEEPEPEPEPDGVLSVEANVEAAQVNVDGEEKGETPYEETYPAGPLQLKVNADGYLGFGDSIDIEGGMLNSVYVTLAGEDEKPERLSIPFWIAAGAAGAGLVLGGVGWGVFGYNKSSESNYAETIEDIEDVTDLNYNQDCSGDTVPDEVTRYYCTTEYNRRDYADKAKLGLGMAIPGTILFAAGGTMAALFFFKPEWFFGPSTDAEITITPLITDEQASMALGGTF